MYLFLIILSFITFCLGLLLVLSKNKLNIAGHWVINNSLFVYTSMHQPFFEASYFFVAVGVYLICHYLRFFSLNKLCWFLIGLCIFEVLFSIAITTFKWYDYYNDILFYKTYIAFILCIPIFIQFPYLLSNVKVLVKEQISPLNFRFYNFLEALVYPFILICLLCLVIVFANDFIDQVPYRFESVFIILLTTSIYVFYLSYFKFTNEFKCCLSKTIVETRKSHDVKFPKGIIRLNSYNDKIDNEKLFLDSNLTLQSLSDQLQVHPKVFSGLINNHYKMSFNEYINKKRIESSKKMLFDLAYSNYTITAIGLESGFSSRSTFYSTFKKYVGCTPTEYKKKIHQKLILS